MRAESNLTLVGQWREMALGEVIELKRGYDLVTEQRVIAHILGTLDDKIELSRRMNQTLEEMARAIFKDWFIDFGPIRAKMKDRWRRGESFPASPPTSSR